MKVPLPGYTKNSIYAHESELPADMTFGFHYIKKEYSEGKPHTHPGHEFLFFVGGDPEGISDFDAEVQMAPGEEGEVHMLVQNRLSPNLELRTIRQSVPSPRPSPAAAGEGAEFSVIGGRQSRPPITLVPMLARNQSSPAAVGIRPVGYDGQQWRYRQ
jgi:hypothetical protein